MTLIRYAVAALLLSCCAFGVASATSRRPPRVIFHPTYRVGTVPPARARVSIPYAGTVASIPAIVDQPTAIAFDPASQSLYVVDQWVANGTLELLRVSPLGATTRIAALPANQIFGLAYDPATSLLYATGRGPNRIRTRSCMR
jgi:hypothetical protein